jgi:murein DD-endopeptidase MepM/ murein hydrolase activator NlpD
VSQSLGEILNCDSHHYATVDVTGLEDSDESSAKISYPSAIPTEGYMTSGYGRRRSPFHDRLVQHRGVDYGVPRGSPIYATADGVVVFSGWRGSFGKTVIVDHGNGVMTVYAHASKLSVKVGDTITSGAIVGKVGSTGRSTGPHLHYEIWVNGRATNPLHFQRSGDAKVLLVNTR